ncbi:MAG: DUF1036 domain-containing protein [Proteobacteria bacterium]|nr:DUF1036 domain-containing protein [Pseudomonadota bacterium]
MAGLAVTPDAARADLKLCNRLSYIVETAIGIEDKGAAATRGWFRIDPGQCRVVLKGDFAAEHIYLHARALALYGGSPAAQTGHTELCISPGNFVIAAARSCTRAGQRLAQFSEIKPTVADDAQVAVLAEDADYDDAQARLAGIQRLLTYAGYDASPIDGLAGPKTDAALARFLKDRKLTAEAAAAPDFFAKLLEVIEHPEGVGFAWCNDTRHVVMAALGVEDKDAVHARGWYRVEPGKCLRPEIKGSPSMLYSFGEAVDGDGAPVRRAGKPLTWGGTKLLCTRETSFELTEHVDCAAAGLSTSGFAVVDFSRATTLRFREP